MDRREFIGAGLAGLLAGRVLAAPASEPRVPVHDRICLFTDHLDDFGFSYADVAPMFKELGIAGPDLTVRPGGFIAPERATEELPKAAAVFREHGLSIPMISTGLTSADDPAARPTLETMRRLGIRHYKLGYYAYGRVEEWQSQLEATRRALAGLVDLNREFGVTAGFHNHAGPSVGGALWDSWELLRETDPAAIGFYYDPAQATIEGGKHAWKLNFQRIVPRLAIVAVKDFVWEKSGGEWRTRWVPLGEGMVRWTEFFAMLAAGPFDGPLSLHIEYDPGGRTRVERLDNSLAAAQRDLAFLRARLEEAE